MLVIKLPFRNLDRRFGILLLRPGVFSETIMQGLSAHITES